MEKREKMRVAVVLALLAIAFEPAAEAGPFQNFFRKVRHALAHPEKSTPHHKTSRRSANKTPLKSSASRSNTVTEHPGMSGPPSEANTRTAKALSSKKPQSAAMPYGAPVPGKQGFVTSPFAPNSGYVDVRGFPPGTRVKDPYSGKVFLTP